MFTGIIGTTGALSGREVRGQAGTLRVRPGAAWPDPVTGESIAVNGACLTLESASGGEWRFHVLAETLARTTLGRLPVGATVNLERALRVGDRLGGHMVTGHVDATVPVLALTEVAGGDWELALALPPELRAQVVLKGSVAVDGVSLTVTAVAEDSCRVHLIPETRRRTRLGACAVGELVNLETDLLGKYVLRALAVGGKDVRPGLDWTSLQRAGW